MPIYEFECDTCGAISEEFYRSVPREVPTHLTKACVTCGDVWSVRSHKKVVSKTSFQLGKEGVGWAKEGYDRGVQDGSKVTSITEP